MSDLHLADCANDVCPWTGRPVSPDGLALYRGRVVGFADRVRRDAFLSAIVALETAIRPTPGACPADAAA